MPEIHSNINQISSALEEEYTLYKTLLGMSIAQKNAAETGDMPAIIRILQERIKVIARLDMLSLKTKEMSNNKLSGNSRVSDLVVSVNQMINKIIECDAKSQAALSEIQKGIEERLSEINKGLHKVKCMPKSSTPPKFISLKL